MYMYFYAYIYIYILYIYIYIHIDVVMQYLSRVFTNIFGGVSTQKNGEIADSLGLVPSAGKLR